VKYNVNIIGIIVGPTLCPPNNRYLSQLFLSNCAGNIKWKFCEIWGRHDLSVPPPTSWVSYTW